MEGELDIRNGLMYTTIGKASTRASNNVCGTWIHSNNLLPLGIIKREVFTQVDFCLINFHLWTSNLNLEICKIRSHVERHWAFTTAGL
jgi:hypothetical protein